ncbi:MAG: hypothetical protein ABI397_03210 [Candidatus Saccharimonas sp.]
MARDFDNARHDFILPTEPAYRVISVPTHDLYINPDRERIVAQLGARMVEGLYGDPSIDLTRKRTNQIDLNNPSTRWMYENVNGFADWHVLMPTAAALEPIYNPMIEELANGKSFTSEMRAWMSNIDDAIGIRSRAVVMKWLITREAINGRERNQRWASLACGVATPIIEVLSRLKEDGVALPKVTLADYQGEALSLAQATAEQAGVGDAIETRRMNILRQGGIAFRHDEGGLHGNITSAMGKLPAEWFDVVDAVGILEYLEREDRQFNYGEVIHTKRAMAGAIQFLRNSFDLVRPGGIMVVGNMRETHPQLGFTLNVIQWPHIQPRSIEQMHQMFAEAGLGDDIETYCPDDNVYAIYSIRKH